MSYMTLSSHEKPLFQKRIPFMTPVLLCSYFRAPPTTLLLNILGGPMHGTSPHPKLWGGLPPSPPRSPPLSSEQPRWYHEAYLNRRVLYTFGFYDNNDQNSSESMDLI